MKYLNYCFILFMLSSCITSTKNNNKTVQLYGHISNFKEGKVKLYYLYPAPISYKLVDSADLINGNFSFDKTLEEPCIALLKFEAKDYKVYYTRSFWIENSKINIKLALEANHLVDIIEGSEIDQLSNKINFFWHYQKGIKI